jgi:hypothetical protein
VRHPSGRHRARFMSGDPPAEPVRHDGIASHFEPPDEMASVVPTMISEKQPKHGRGPRRAGEAGAHRSLHPQMHEAA